MKCDQDRRLDSKAGFIPICGESIVFKVSN